MRFSLRVSAWLALFATSSYTLSIDRNNNKWKRSAPASSVLSEIAIEDVETQSAGSPLVDSSSLRFESQKRENLLRSTATKLNSNSTIDAALQQSIFETFEKTLFNVRIENSVYSSYIDRYSCTGIAQVLQSRFDIDFKTAHRAGKCVYDHVLARSTRRRLREVMKLPDTLWLEREQQIYSRSMDYSSDYGFEDTVDVLVEFGLSGKDIVEILEHTPNIAVMRPRKRILMSRNNGVDCESFDDGETLEETLTRGVKNILCGSLKLRRYDARNIVRNCPGLLTMGGSRAAEQVVCMFSKLGVSLNSRDKRALPTLLARPPSAIFRIIAFLSSNDIRMPLDKIGSMLRRKESVELLNAVAPVTRLSFYGNLESETASTTLDKKAEDDTRLFTPWDREGIELQRKNVNEIYNNMLSVVRFLRNEIGANDLGKIISAYPEILLLNVSTQIFPVASYLLNEVGIRRGDLPKVLQLFPMLLGKDVDDLDRTVSFMLEKGVPEGDIASIVRSFPKLLTLDVEENMIPVTEFLSEIGIVNIGRFISRLPVVLGYSVEDEIIPKYTFLKSIYPYETFELSKFPAYLSYPLDRVIKARFEYLESVKGLPTQLIALNLVVQFGDRDFATQVAGDEDNGEEYLKFLKERNERNSDSKRTKKGQRRIEDRKKRIPKSYNAN